jgi:hypothetical protein
MNGNANVPELADARERIARATNWLLCAQVNCDNVKVLGAPAMFLVKEQIREALACFEEGQP